MAMDKTAERHREAIDDDIWLSRYYGSICFPVIII